MTIPSFRGTDTVLSCRKKFSRTRSCAV